MVIRTDLGTINVTKDVIQTIAGHTAVNCLGVKGMTVASFTDGVSQLLNLENMSKGVKIADQDDGGVGIELNISIEYGVSINAVCCSVIKEVRYMVEKLTDIDVNYVNVYVDSIKAG